MIYFNNTTPDQDITCIDAVTGATPTGIFTNVGPIFIAPRPTAAVSFLPSSVASGATTTLTYNLGNTTGYPMTLTSAFSNTLPAGMTIVGASPGGTCTGVTATTGSNTVAMANGTQIPNGGCTITVSVASSAVGTRTVSVPAGAFAVDGGLTNAATSANLTVTPSPTLSVSKSLPSARASAADQFDLAIRTGSASGAVVASGTTSGSGTTATGGTGTFTGVTGTAYTITEAMTSGSGSVLGQYASTITCTDSAGVTAGLPNNAVFNQATGYTTPALAANAQLSCTIANTPRAPTLRLTKALSNNRVSATDQFTVQLRAGSISGSVVNATANSTTTGTGSTVTAGTGTTGTFAATPGTTYVLSEVGAGATLLSRYQGSLTCTDASGFQIGLPSAQAFDPATGFAITPVAGATINCVLTNSLAPGVYRLQKNLPNGRADPTDQFEMRILNGVGPSIVASATTGGTGTTVTGGVASVTNGPTLVTFTEVMAPGSASVISQYNSRITCVDPNGITSGLPTNQVFNPATGFVLASGGAPTDITCTITNTPRTASLEFRKALSTPRVANSNQFLMSIHTGSLTGPTVDDDTTAGSGASVGSGNPQVSGAAPGTTYYLRERPSGTTNLAQYVGTLTCTDANGFQTGLPTGVPYDPAVGAQITVVAGASLTCTVTNAARAPTISLTKSVPVGRRSATDQFDLAIRTGGVSGSPVASGTTAGTGTTATGGTGVFTGVAGTAYTLTEAMATGSASMLSQYTSMITCSDATGVQTGLPSAASFNPALGLTITPVAGAAISCVIDNLPLPSPTLTKAFSVPRIAIGGTANLVFTVTNSAGNPAQSGFGFTDTLTAPNGLVLAAAPTAAQCGGTVSGTAGGSTITFSGGSLVAGAASCTITVPVTHAPAPTVSASGLCPTSNTNGAANIIGLTNLTNNVSNQCLVVQPRVRLAKQVLPAAVSAVGRFNLTIAGTNISGTPNPVTDIASGSATGYVAVDGGTAVTLTEAAFTGTNIASYSPNLACANGSGGTVAVSGSGVSRTITAPNGVLANAADGTIDCTFANTATTLTLAKAWAPGSIAGDAVSIGATSGLTTNTTAFTATAGTSATSNTVVVVPGQTITFPAETFTIGSGANYTTAISCLADGGATGNALTGSGNGQATGNQLLIAASDTGKDIVCTYTNAALNRPTIALAFSPTSVLPNQPTTLTYTIGSTTGSAFTLASAFSSSLAANMRVVGIVPGGTCTGVTAATGGTTVSMASGTAIPAGGCTIEVSVAVFVSTGLPVSRTVTVPAGAIVASGGLSNASPASATVTVPSFTPNFTFPGLTMSKAVTSGRAHPSDQFVLTVSGIRSSPTAGPGSESVTTTGSGTVATGTTATFLTSTAAPPTGDNFTLTEAMAPGSASVMGQYDSTITCTDSTSGRPGAASLPLGAAFNPAGTVINRYNSADIRCIVNNTPKPATLSLTKSLGSARIAASDQFAVAIRTGGVGGAPVASGTTTGSGNTVTGGTGTTGVFAATFGTAYTLTEQMAPGSASALSQYNSTITCIDPNGFQPGLPSNASYNPVTGFTITPVAGAAIACTITNSVGATISVQKALPSGRVAAADQFELAIRTGGVGGTPVATGLTTGTGTTATGGTGSFLATPSTVYTLTEAMASGSASALGQYTSTISCTDTAGVMTSGLPSGPFNPATGANITPVAGAAIACTITNTALGGLSGRVFLDTGIGGGIANDGVLNGGEQGQAGVAVRLTDCAGTVYASTLTGSAGEWSFAASPVAAGAPLCVDQGNLGNAISTGASVNGTALPSGTPTPVGGVTYTYDRAGTPDAVALTWATVASSNGIDFGDVPPSLFGASGAKTGGPGSTVSYAHTFTAGTAGSVVFSIPSTTATPANPGWAQLVYADPTCSGSLQPGATQLFPPLGAGEAVIAGENVCIIVQQRIPADAAVGATNQAQVQADFTFSAATPSLSATYSVEDVTRVSTSALDLMKDVRNVTSGGPFGTNNEARPGDVLEYRITFTNNAAAPISNLVLNDTTPAYATFVSAGVNAPLPAALSACIKNTPANPSPAAPVACSAAQAAGGSGAISWTFTGTLAPGASGSVTFQVTVQ